MAGAAAGNPALTSAPKRSSPAPGSVAGTWNQNRSRTLVPSRPVDMAASALARRRTKVVSRTPGSWMWIAHCTVKLHTKSIRKAPGISRSSTSPTSPPSHSPPWLGMCRRRGRGSPRPTAKSLPREWEREAEAEAAGREPDRRSISLALAQNCRSYSDLLTHCCRRGRLRVTWAEPRCHANGRSRRLAADRHCGLNVRFPPTRWVSPIEF
jgi:hypothetical protein